MVLYKDITELQAIKLITDVLNRDRDFVRFEGISPSKMINLVFKAGADYIIEDEMEFNGWEYDFFIPVTHNHKSFFISGSGYYGTACIGLESC